LFDGRGGAAGGGWSGACSIVARRVGRGGGTVPVAEATGGRLVAGRGGGAGEVGVGSRRAGRAGGTGTGSSLEMDEGLRVWGRGDAAGRGGEGVAVCAGGRLAGRGGGARLVTEPWLDSVDSVGFRVGRGGFAGVGGASAGAAGDAACGRGGAGGVGRWVGALGALATLVVPGEVEREVVAGGSVSCRRNAGGGGGGGLLRAGEAAGEALRAGAGLLGTAGTAGTTGSRTVGDWEREIGGLGATLASTGLGASSVGAPAETGIGTTETEGAADIGGGGGGGLEAGASDFSCVSGAARGG
jgi:hypothetical protein